MTDLEEAVRAYVWQTEHVTEWEEERDALERLWRVAYEHGLGCEVKSHDHRPYRRVEATVSPVTE